jgi:hypothetical protein
MPTVHNPAPFDVFCHHLGRSLHAKQTVEVTEDEARVIAESPLFMTDGQEVKLDIRQNDVDTDLTAEQSGEKTAAQRTTGKRGSTVVEETAAPETEKR